MSCSLLFAVAVTAHINVGSTNAVHPVAEVECYVTENLDANVGVYYNSISKVSTYATLAYPFDNNMFIEAGLVSGYLDKPIPYGRVGYNLNDSVTLFAAPAYDSGDVGAVLGIQYNF